MLKIYSRGKYEGYPNLSYLRIRVSTGHITEPWIQRKKVHIEKQTVLQKDRRRGLRFRTKSSLGRLPRRDGWVGIFFIYPVCDLKMTYGVSNIGAEYLILLTLYDDFYG